jgi:hypothetical protein
VDSLGVKEPAATMRPGQNRHVNVCCEECLHVARQAVDALGIKKPAATMRPGRTRHVDVCFCCGARCLKSSVSGCGCAEQQGACSGKAIRAYQVDMCFRCGVAVKQCVRLWVRCVSRNLQLESQQVKPGTLVCVARSLFM